MVPTTAQLDEILRRIPGPASPEWPQGEPFALALAHGTMSVEVYAPRGQDLQAPHTQDELYFIQSGSGEFVQAGVRRPFAPGTVLFVPAGVEHRFEHFTPDFTTWVVFWGPPGGERS